jgi:archaellum component FlaC
MDRIDKLEIEIAKLDGFTRGLADSLRFLVEKLERLEEEIYLLKINESPESS